MKKNVMKVLAAVLVCAFLVGCGTANLEKIMNSAEGQKMIADQKDQIVNGSAFGGVYSDFDIETVENALTYKYYYSADFDADQIESIKAELPDSADWSTTIAGVKDEIENSSKIRPTSVTFAYYTADGEEIFTVTE